MIGKASAVMRALRYSVAVKRELSKKAKLSIFKTVFMPILTRDEVEDTRLETKAKETKKSEAKDTKKSETKDFKMCSRGRLRAQRRQQGLHL